MKIAALTCVFLAGLVLAGPAGAARGQDPTALADLFAVTEDHVPRGVSDPTGCEAISLFTLDGERVYGGRREISPGRVGAARDMSLLVATQSNGVEPFLQAVRRDGNSADRWSSSVLKGADISTFGGVAALRDGRTVLVATSRYRREAGGGVVPIPIAPFYVRKYELPRIGPPEVRLGLPLGSVQTDGVAVEILLSSDERLAHLLTQTPGAGPKVYTIDVATMAEVAAPIALQPVAGIATYHFQAENPLSQVQASLSGDGRYLVTNRGRVAEVNVADLEARRAWSLPVSADVSFTGGVALNRGWANEGLLAVHASDKIVLYRFEPLGPLHEVGRTAVDPPWDLGQAIADAFGPKLTVAWSGAGSHLIAATDHRTADFAVFEVTGEGAVISGPTYVVACMWAKNFPNDIVTANGMIEPPPTVTSSPVPIPTRSATASAVPPTATSTPAAIPTLSVTVSPCPTPAARPTLAPQPAYLPLALREQCIPGFQHSDVALVIDASTSMRDEFTNAGRRKIDAAREAVAIFLDQLDLAGGDQAAIIQFNSDSTLLVGLTRREADLRQGLASITIARQTRIHLGISKAHAELTGPRHRPTNSTAMVVLTDGRNNPEPVAEAEREAALARADDIRVFTIGLGAQVEAEALARMATIDVDCFFAPDGEDLISIYRRVAHAIPCPPEQFWGRR